MGSKAEKNEEEDEEEELEQGAPFDASATDIAKPKHVHPSLHKLDPVHVAEVQERLKTALSRPEVAADLDLSALDLYFLPPEVMKRSWLVELTLRSNCLMEFPSELTSLASLAVLDLSRNRIEEIPEAIGELRSLRDLNLMNNHLRRLERSMPLAAFASLTSLERLNVRFNPKLMSAKLEEVLRAHVPAGCQLLLGGSTSGKLFTPPAARDATLLRSQLEPWGTPTLRRRLADEFQVETDPDLGREGIFELLLAAYAAKGPRSVSKARGLSPPEHCAGLLAELLEELRGTDFPTGEKRERQGVQAQGYIVLRRQALPCLAGEADLGGEDGKESGATGIGAGAMFVKDCIVQPGMRTLRPTPQPNLSKNVWSRRKNAGKFEQHERAWHMALQLVESVDPAFAKRCSAIALTKNFVGSPHIDIENYGPFYGLSLGDFTGGGICVESTPLEVVEVDTRNRFGKVDGRWPHWVAPYSGERCSVIYYQTEGPEIPKTTSWFPAEVDPF